jgi:transcriptional regulator with XRE-family HTH domain
MNGKNIIGSRVRKARKESKITQMELAARLQVVGVNIERPAISKLESGNRPVTDIEVAALAEALKVPISWLFEGP